MKRLRIVATALGAVLCCYASADEPLRMSVRAAWEGLPSNAAVPMVVEISNNVPVPAKGVLHVGVSPADQVYPVDLPANGGMKLMTYPQSYGGPVNFSLETNFGRARHLVNEAMGGPAVYPQASWLLSISSKPNQYSFLAIPRGKDHQRTFSVADCEVDNAPTRSSAYDQLSVVALGEGCEHLTDSQVEALRNYALTGGTIAFVGGASGAINDPRWASLMPVKDFYSTQVSEFRLADGRSVLSNANVLSGTPTPNAVPLMVDNKLVGASLGCGLGKVVYLGFNPVGGPPAELPGRTAVVEGLLKATDKAKASQFFSYRYPTPPAANSSSAADPFSFKLPPLEHVFGLLSLYFVLVVPVNFLVLRKLRRPELAWVTAPVLSLGFAGVLFASARGLYGAQMATASQGMIVAQAGVKESIFVGNTQFFIPQGGFYDLKLEGVETLGIGSGMDTISDSGYGGTGYQVLQVGNEVQLPMLRTSNLSFNNIGYRQRVEAGDWFKVDKLSDGKWKVTNTSPFDFDVSLVTARGSSNGVSLRAGQTTTMDAPTTHPVADLDLYLKTGNRVALYGQVHGFRPGPRLGTEIEARSSITYAYFLEETL